MTWGYNPNILETTDIEAVHLDAAESVVQLADGRQALHAYIVVRADSPKHPDAGTVVSSLSIPEMPARLLPLEPAERVTFFTPIPVASAAPVAEEPVTSEPPAAPASEPAAAEPVVASEPPTVEEPVAPVEEPAPAPSAPVFAAVARTPQGTVVGRNLSEMPAVADEPAEESADAATGATELA